VPTAAAHPTPHPWPYVTPGITDSLFERLPGIPMTQRETRLAILSQLRLESTSVLWDIGAGTGTIPVETGLICPHGRIIAVERDPDVVALIQANCDRFRVKNVEIHEGSAPECLDRLPAPPDRICIEGGKDLAATIDRAWELLDGGGRIVIIANTLDALYVSSERLATHHARHIEVVQSTGNRLEKRGSHQIFAPVAPAFILSGEKSP